jgi:hypothetical protein
MGMCALGVRSSLEKRKTALVGLQASQVLYECIDPQTE